MSFMNQNRSPVTIIRGAPNVTTPSLYSSNLRQTVNYASQRNNSVPPLILPEPSVRVQQSTHNPSMSFTSSQRVVTGSNNASVYRTETRYAPQPGADVASMVTQMPTQQPVDPDRLSKNELIEKISNEEREILELKRLVSSLRESSDVRTRQLIHQVEELTKELLALREQNYKLKNLTNDELVMLEKVETKEVYGKKTKVQEELDAAKALRVEHQNTIYVLQAKEARVGELEREIAHLKSIQLTPTKIYQSNPLLEKKNVELMNELADLRGQMAARQRDFELKINDMRNENLAMRSERGGADQLRIADLERRINELLAENSRLKTVTQVHRPLTSEKETSLVNEIANLRSKIGQLEGDLRSVSARNADYVDQITQYRTKVSSSISSASEQKLSGLESQLRDANRKLSDALNELQKSRQHERELESQLFELQKNVKELSGALNDTTNELNSTRQRESERNGGLISLQKELASTAEKLRNANAELLQLKQKTSQRDSSAMQSEQAVRALEQTTQQLRVENELLKNTIEESAALSSQKVFDANNEVSRLNQQKNQYHANMLKAESALKHAQDRARELEHRLELLQGEKAQMAGLMEATHQQFEKDRVNLKEAYEAKIREIEQGHAKSRGEVETQLKRQIHEKHQAKLELEQKLVHLSSEHHHKAAEKEHRLMDLLNEKEGLIAQLRNQISGLLSEKNGLQSELNTKVQSLIQQNQNLKLEYEKRFNAGLESQKEEQIARLEQENANLKEIVHFKEMQIAEEQQKAANELARRSSSQSNQLAQKISELEHKVLTLSAENNALEGILASRPENPISDNGPVRQELERKMQSLIADKASIKKDYERRLDEMNHEAMRNMQILEQKLEDLTNDKLLMKMEYEKRLAQLSAEKIGLRADMDKRMHEHSSRNIGAFQDLKEQLDVLSKENNELKVRLKEAIERLPLERAAADKGGERRPPQSESEAALIKELREQLVFMGKENHRITEELEKKRSQLVTEKAAIRNEFSKKLSEVEARAEEAAVELQERVAQLEGKNQALRSEHEKRLSQLAQEKSILKKELEKRSGDGGRDVARIVKELEEQVGRLADEKNEMGRNFETLMNKKESELQFVVNEYEKKLAAQSGENQALKGSQSRPGREAELKATVVELQQLLARMDFEKARMKEEYEKKISYMMSERQGIKSELEQRPGENNNLAAGNALSNY